MAFFKKFDDQNWEILCLKTNLIAEETKKSTKIFLTNTTNLNLLTGTLIIGFPIIFYLTCLGENKKKELNELIETSLPGLSTQQNKISWETFQKTNYLPIPTNSANLSFQKDSINDNFFEKTQFQQLIYQNSLSNLEIWGHSFRFELNENWKSYKKNFFLGIKSNITDLNSEKYFIYPSRENINSPEYTNLYTNQTPNFKILKFYQLDEYPLKLESINSPLNNWTKLPININIPIEKIELASERKNFWQSSQNRNLELIGLKKISFKKPEANSIDKLNRSKKTLFENFNSFNQKNVKWRELITSIKNIEKQTNYNLTLPLNNLEKSERTNKILDSKYTLLASHQLLNVLNENFSNNPKLFNIKGDQTSSISQPRLMSGFIYPDLTKNLILRYHLGYSNFFLQPSLKHLDNQVKTYFGPHFVYPEFHWNNKVEPLKFAFQYYPISFEMLSGKTTYKGPAVVLPNSYQTRLCLRNNYLRENISNLKTILNKPDVGHNQSIYSFGNVLNDIRPKLQAVENLGQTYKNSQQNILFKTYSGVKPLSQERFSKHPLFEYKSDYIVPYLNGQEWQNWLAKKSSFTKIDNGLIQGFPLRKIQLLVNSDLKISYDSMDYQNSSWIFKNINTNIKNYEENNGQYAFINCNDIGKYQNIFYQNIRTIYKNDQINSNQNTSNLTKLEPKVFREVWEPIHQNSWLTINKFLFALLIVHILKQFIQEYGKELVAYLVDLFASIGIVDDSLKEELAPQTLSETYRLITKNKKDFRNITGINHIFTDIAEIVWFLRNLGRPFKLGRLVPKGLLLVGSPGTGKTLLVQAIAGEAEVPVLVQSASTLHRLEGRGPQKLKNLFEKARELAPCIVFFDELDSIGEKRSKIIANPVDQTNLLTLLYWKKKQIYTYGIPLEKRKKPINIKKLMESGTAGVLNEFSSNNQEQSPEQLCLLMQLLIELDGLQVNQNLVVIGATNRPEILDPALTRPGRLSKCLEIGLPNKESRIGICQLYSRFLGVSTDVCWNTIAEETRGLSGADLATIMNQSSIQAILSGTKHTKETINISINKVLGLGNYTYNDSKSVTTTFSEPYIAKQNKNLKKHLLLCSAYNEAGFKVVEYLLPNYKKPISAKLISTRKNSRYKNQNLDFFIKTQQLTTQYKNQFRFKIIAELAGKASEFLILKRSSLAKWDQFQTLLNLGTNQLHTVSRLIYFTISKEGFFPSSSPFLNFALSDNQNLIEHIDSNMVDLFTNLASNYEKDLLTIEFSKYKTFQRWTTKSWWQVEVTNLDKFQNTNKSSWYRLFVMHPDNSTASDERLSPDNYFHANNLYFLTRTLSFNGKFEQRRDLLFKEILSGSFKLTSMILISQRELLDFLAVILLQKQTLTETELNYFFENLIINPNRNYSPQVKYLTQLSKNKLFKL